MVRPKQIISPSCSLIPTKRVFLNSCSLLFSLWSYIFSLFHIFIFLCILFFPFLSFPQLIFSRCFLFVFLFYQISRFFNSPLFLIIFPFFSLFSSIHNLSYSRNFLFSHLLKNYPFSTFMR